MTNRKQMGERVLKLEGGPKDDGRIARDAKAFRVKFFDLIDRFSEDQRHVPVAEQLAKWSIVSRSAWLVRFEGVSGDEALKRAHIEKGRPWPPVIPGR